jgi:hypothetical protein
VATVTSSLSHREVARALGLLLALAASSVRAQPSTTAATEEAPSAEVAAEAGPEAAAARANPGPSPAPETGSGESSALADALARNAALEERVANLERAQAERDLEDLDTSELARPDLFRVYGFADFGVNHAWVDEDSFLHGLVLRDTTFTLGNLNLYFDFQPGPEWQVLTELRFTTYPHGVDEDYATPFGGEYLRIDTTTIDIASPATASTLRWGGIVIERAYAQWSHSELLALRVGQFLTPYGIWNVDHGTPTLIALMLPHFVAVEALPARQIGVEATGRVLSGAWEYGYSAYVSNGRTATHVDFTEDKAIGARLRIARQVPVPISFGASAYYGQIDDVHKLVDSFEPFHVDSRLVVEGHEVGLGVDVALDLDALRVRAEGVMHMTRYEEGKRPPRSIAQPGALESDSNEYDSYLLVAYRLPWLGLEPFAYGELDHFVSPYGDEQAIASLGLNIHFTPFAQLKTQVSRAMFFDLDRDGDFGRNDMTLLYSRLAVAF